MSAVLHLIRHAPREGLQAFFDAEQCPLGDRLRSFGPDDDYSAPLLKAIDDLSDREHAQLTVNADRVEQMASEVGKCALLSIIQDRLLVAELENAYARSLWVFLNAPDSFRRAEEIRYTDGYRHSPRMWNAYEGPKRVVPDMGVSALTAFQEAARKIFGSLDAHCEIYRRTRPNFEQPDSELYQLTVYHDDLPGTFLEFDNKRLVRRHRRPVVEVSISYEPRTGILEVVASAGKYRDQLARAFADIILRQQIATERMPLRRFDLSRLLHPFTFTYDSERDRILSVEVVLLRLQRIGDEARRHTLECPRRAAGTIWDQARAELKGGDDLAAAGYLVTRATLSVKFLPGVGSRRGETVTFNITVPDGSNLKGQTERQRLIGARLLKGWGLLIEI